MGFIAIILAVSLTGCTDPAEIAVPDAPGAVILPFGELERHECLIAEPGSQILLGDMLGPTLDEVTITNVELEAAVGLRVQGVFLLDPSKGTPYATWASVPQDEVIWTTRVEAEGATLLPGEVRNIVIQAEVLDQASASVAAVTVEYESGDFSGSITGLVTYEIAAACA